MSDPIDAQNAPEKKKAAFLRFLLPGRTPGKPGNGLALLALVISSICLFLLLSDRFLGTKNDSLASLNGMMTDKVVPEMKRARELEVVNEVYELKHISVTLQKIRDTTKNEEVKTMIEKLRKDIEDISVKIYVHE